MPKIKCDCGEIIGLGEIPSPNQYLIISDEDYDKFTGNIDAEELFMKMKIVVMCPNCKRLHIFWNGFDKPPAVYRPE